MNTLEYLIRLDQQLLLWFQQYHNPFWDQVMFLLSEKEVWIPLYLFLIYLLYRYFKKRFWLPLLFTVLTVGFNDAFTSRFMKPYFRRPRPSHEVLLEGRVHVVNNYRGGPYGFVSSHSANSFGLATFLTLLFYRRWPFILLLYPWAILVAYTRVYLGVHYPLDIFVGGLIGLLSAYLFYALHQLVYKKIYPD